MNVSFGMKCLTAALNAKSGSLERGAAEKLIEAARNIEPADPEAMVAAAQFADGVRNGDARAAGDAMLRYLTPMRAGFAWQERADLQ